jgi:hypothetical protein
MLRRILISITLLIWAGIAFSYTAVLKNGKKIEGVLVGEDENQIWVKDSEGVTITIRKSILDLELSKESNSESIPETIAPVKEGVSQDKSLAEIAREAKRTGNSRVFRNEDLKNLPEITVLGTRYAARTSAERDQDEEVEKAWKEVALEIYRRLEWAAEKYESLRKQCDELSMAAGFAADDSLQTGTPLGSPVIAQAAEACARMEQAQEDLLVVQEEFEMLQDEARQKVIPPGWVDPERFQK